jgi:hypothetical protein
VIGRAGGLPERLPGYNLANLVDAIETQCNRVRRAMSEYEGLPGNETLVRDVLHGVITQAENMAASGDHAKMLNTLEALRRIVPWYR